MDEEEQKRQAASAAFAQAAAEEPQQEPMQESVGIPEPEPQIQQPVAAVPGASEAFAQLDQASAQNPTQFDQASVSGLEPAQQRMVRENFDANLEAATRAVEEYAQGDDAFSRQAQRLLERAERARERQVEQAAMPAPVDIMRAPPDYSQMAQPDRSRAIRENARMGAQKRFVPLTTPEDYLASAMADLEMRNGRDPFEI